MIESSYKSTQIPNDEVSTGSENFFEYVFMQAKGLTYVPNYDELAADLKFISENESIPTKFRREALCHRIFLQAKGLFFVPSYDQLAIDLKSIYKNKRISPEFRREALCHSVFKQAIGIFNVSNDDLLFKRLKGISESTEFPDEFCKEAKCHLIFMQARGQINIQSNDQLANDLKSIIKDKNISLSIKDFACFYLAELVLTDRTKLLTIEKAISFMKYCLSNNKLPMNIQDRAAQLIDQQSYSLSKLSNFESISFEYDFPRTEEMKKVIKNCLAYDQINNFLQVDDQTYSVITSKTKIFSQFPLASCGSSLGREVILLDPNNSPVLNEHFRKIELAISKFNEPLSEDEIIKFVLDYIRKEIFPEIEDASLKLHSFISEQQKNVKISKILVGKTLIPAIPIDNFILNKLGLCRHHGLVTAYILDGLIEKKYLFGIVQIIRDKIIRDGIVLGAHSWASYVNSQKKIHIDTFWDLIIDFSSEEGKNIIREKYGSETLDRQIKKTII